MALNTDEDTEPIVQAPSSVHARKGMGGASLGLAVGFVFYENYFSNTLYYRIPIS